MTAPQTPIVEAKVKTSAAAASAVGLALGLLSQTVFHGGPVPDVVDTIVTTSVSTLVSGGLTFLVGWLTRHTPRDVIQIDTREG